MGSEKINLLGVNISRVDYGKAVDEIIERAREGASFGVTALAVHGVMEARLDPRFASKVNSLNLVTPDGQPVRWALNLLGARELKDRVYGPTLTLKVCARAAAENLPIYLYGSKESTVQKLAHNLERMFPGIKIVGIQPDRFREATPDEDRSDVERINESGAKIVFVGRGCPRQEKWVADHLGRINAVMIAVGAAFDFHAGTTPQAPRMMQDWGLEWFYRLVHDPKRLWRRYLILNPLFIYNFGLQFTRVRDYTKTV